VMRQRQQQAMANKNYGDRTRSVLDSLAERGYAHLGRMRSVDVQAFKAAMSKREETAKKESNLVFEDFDVLNAPGGIASVLKNRTVRNIVKAYLGSDAAFGRVVYTRLDQRIKSARDFVSGTFHHDRLGRRLRLFVLLSNSSAKTGRPLVVARGSQHLIYPQYLCDQQPIAFHCASHFTERFVHERFDLDAVGGLEGEAYLFDTNTIHRGSPGEGKERQTIMFTFGSAGKMRLPHLLSWATTDHLATRMQLRDRELRAAISENGLLDDLPLEARGDLPSAAFECG